MSLLFPAVAPTLTFYTSSRYTCCLVLYILLILVGNVCCFSQLSSIGILITSMMHTNADQSSPSGDMASVKIAQSERSHSSPERRSHSQLTRSSADAKTIKRPSAFSTFWSSHEGWWTSNWVVTWDKIRKLMGIVICDTPSRGR